MEDGDIAEDMEALELEESEGSASEGEGEGESETEVEMGAQDEEDGSEDQFMQDGHMRAVLGRNQTDYERGYSHGYQEGREDVRAGRVSRRQFWMQAKSMRKIWTYYTVHCDWQTCL